MSSQAGIQINFETFILSLGTAILVGLGEVENPVTGKREQNLGSAKQNIDVLEMLLEKTRNNLSETEGRLLNQILYEVRLKYVEKSSNKKAD